MQGATGRILRVNLTTGDITVDQPGEEFYRAYLGGAGFVSYFLLNEIPAGTDPLSPDNVLVFAIGPMTGLAMPGNSRNCVGAKSPLTGGFSKSEVGGFWPYELKRAGYDAIIVHGRAANPAYLLITNDAVEIRDASRLWGKTVAEAHDLIVEETGIPAVRTAAIGPGGENMVRYACVVNDFKEAAGRGGTGAVMGSKNLKAIAVRGARAPIVADPARIRELTLAMNNDPENLWKGGDLHAVGTGSHAAMTAGNEIGNLPSYNSSRNDFSGVAKITATAAMETYGDGMEGCAACAVRCKKTIDIGDPWNVDPRNGGPEYESLASLGANCGVDDLAAVCKANELANLYSLDTISLGTSIAFGMECFENEIITARDTGGLELRFGNADALIQAIHLIARREGIGDILANGTRMAAQQLGQGADEFAMHVKGLEFGMHDPRVKWGMGVLYSVEAHGADHHAGFHDTMWTQESPAFERLRGMGATRPLPVEDLSRDKVANARALHMWAMFKDSLVACSFVPWSLDQHIEIVRAATGWQRYSHFEALKLGERVATLGRLFNLREGITSAQDHMPKRMFQPTPSGGLRNGGIDEEKMQEAIHTFYGMMGWDRETGVPTRGKLDDLGIGWAADAIPADAAG